MSHTQIPLAVQLTREKFDSSGRPKSMPGNTVLWHLDSKLSLFHMLTDVQRKFQASAIADCFSFLPANSFHVTLFEGCLDKVRSIEHWPQDLDIAVPIESVNEQMGARLKNIILNVELPIVFKFALSKSTPFALVFELVPIDRMNVDKVKAIREQIACAFGYRNPGLNSYRFHITLAYIHQDMTFAERKQFEEMHSEASIDLVNASDLLEVNQPEFCTFDDMTHFERKFFMLCGSF